MTKKHNNIANCNLDSVIHLLYTNYKSYITTLNCIIIAIITSDENVNLDGHKNDHLRHAFVPTHCNELAPFCFQI